MTILLKRLSREELEKAVKNLEGKGFKCVLVDFSWADCMIEEDSGEVIHYILYT